jgi:hypothetical protein
MRERLCGAAKRRIPAQNTGRNPGKKRREVFVPAAPLRCGIDPESCRLRARPRRDCLVPAHHIGQMLRPSIFARLHEIHSDHGCDVGDRVAIAGDEFAAQQALCPAAPGRPVPWAGWPHPIRDLRHFPFLHRRMRVPEGCRDRTKEMQLHPPVPHLDNGAVRASVPISGGSGCSSSRYRQIATDSDIAVPSSSTSTGSRCSGLSLVTSSDLCPSCPISTGTARSRCPFPPEKRLHGADLAPGRHHKAS